MLRIHRKRIHPTMVLPLDKMARMQQRGRQPLRYLLTLLLIGVTGLSLLGYRPLFVVSLTMAVGTLFVTIRYLRAKPVEMPIMA